MGKASIFPCTRDPLLGTPTYPGKENVRLIPFSEEDGLTDLLKRLEDFNTHATKAIDQIRLFLLPLEKII